MTSSLLNCNPCIIMVFLIGGLVTLNESHANKNLQCLPTGNKGCAFTFNAYCCDYFNDANPITPDESIKYLRRIRNLAIANIFFYIFYALASFVAVGTVGEGSQGGWPWFCVQIVSIVLPFSLIYAIIDIFHKRNLVGFFDDLETNKCYGLNSDYTLSYFHSHTNAILILAIIVALFSVINVLITPVVDAGREEGLILAGASSLCLLLMLIILWAYVFPTYEHWNDTYANSDMQCYIITTPHPTHSPTPRPTHSPTRPTESPTPYPTIEPTPPTKAPIGYEDFYCVDASENTPFWLLAAGTFITFLINLYMFYNKQQVNGGLGAALNNPPNNGNGCGCCNCCCQCLKAINNKCAKPITWIIVMYQVGSLIYGFGYTWKLASIDSPDDDAITWDNYQCYAKAFAISSHFKNVITTAFVLLSKNYIISQRQQVAGARYDTSVMVYLFFWALSCAFYGISFLWTHLLLGLIIFCPIVIVGTIGFGMFYVLLRFITKTQYARSQDYERDWVIWNGGLLCTITVVICVIVMECMVIFYDDPSSWTDAIAIVFTERNFESFWQGVVKDIEKIVNLFAMIF